MRSDDLVPMLTPPPMDGLGFRQGTVVTFNSDTGANTIDVGGTTLVDVPMLNSGEAVALSAGHVVALLTWKSSWWILGRVTLPNSDQFASASVAIENVGAANTTFALNTTPGDKATATISVPPWADKATILCVGHGNADNTTTTDAYLAIVTTEQAASGAATNSQETRQMVFAGQQAGSVSTSNHATFFNPGASITVATRLNTQAGTWTGAKTAIVTATAFFQSTA